VLFSLFLEMWLRRGIPHNPLITTVIICSLCYWFFNSYTWTLLAPGPGCRGFLSRTPTTTGFIEDHTPSSDYIAPPPSHTGDDDVSPVSPPPVPVVEPEKPQSPTTASPATSSGAKAPTPPVTTAPSVVSTSSGVKVDYAVATSGGLVVWHSPLYSKFGQLTIGQQIWRFLFPDLRASRIYAPPNLLLYVCFLCVTM
jgi:hypothetical protein